MNAKVFRHLFCSFTSKGGLISEGTYFELCPIANKRCQITPLSKIFNKLFTVKGGKFKFSAQGRDLATIVGNGTKVKKPYEIKPPLISTKEIYRYVQQILLATSRFCFTREMVFCYQN